MNNSRKLALLLSLGALLSVAASAKTLEQSYIDTCRQGPGIPVPIAVVAPTVGGFDIGQSVQVEFVVDTTGHASDFTIRSASDRVLADAVVDAVKQWQFTPALRNGAPVSAKVILPVSVVAPMRSTSMFVLN